MHERPRPRTLAEAIFEALPVPSLAHDENTVLAANSDARKLLGAARADEIVGRDVSAFVHGRGSAAGKAARTFLLDSRQPLAGVTVELVTCRGDDVVVTGCAATCQIGTKLLAILAASPSSRLPQRTRAGLLSFPEGTDLFDAILDAHPLACVAVCGETIAYANAAAASVVRATTPADLIGRHIADVVSPEALESIVEQLRLTFAHGVRLSGVSAKSRALDGEAFMVSGNGCRIRHNGCDYAVFVATHIDR